jgi:hypothetical protein
MMRNPLALAEHPLLACPLLEQMELILVGNVFAEHPQYPFQLLLFVDILDGDCVA